MGMKAERISTYLNSQKVAEEPLDTPQSPQSLSGAEYQHPAAGPQQPAAAVASPGERRGEITPHFSAWGGLRAIKTFLPSHSSLKNSTAGSPSPPLPPQRGELSGSRGGSAGSRCPG